VKQSLKKTTRSHRKEDRMKPGSFAVEAEILRTKIARIMNAGMVPGRAGKFLESALITIDASLGRCSIYPHSPHYTKLVDGAKLTVRMMRSMMKFEGVKPSDEVVDIMNEITAVCDKYFTALKRRKDDIK
jgi:hypothetical protein